MAIGYQELSIKRVFLNTLHGNSKNDKQDNDADRNQKTREFGKKLIRNKGFKDLTVSYKAYLPKELLDNFPIIIPLHL